MYLRIILLTVCLWPICLMAQPKLNVRINQSPKDCGNQINITWKSEGLSRLTASFSDKDLPLNGEHEIYAESDFKISFEGWDAKKGQPIRRIRSISIQRPNLQASLPDKEQVTLKSGAPFQPSYDVTNAEHITVYTPNSIYHFRYGTSILIPDQGFDLADYHILFTNNCGDSLLHTVKVRYHINDLIQYPPDTDGNISWHFDRADSVKTMWGEGLFFSHFDSIPAAHVGKPAELTVYRKSGQTQKIVLKYIPQPNNSPVFRYPPIVFKDQSFQIKWKVPEADFVKLEGKPQKYNQNDSLSLKLEGSTTLVFELHKQGRPVTYYMVFIAVRQRNYIERKKQFRDMVQGEPIHMEIISTHMDGNRISMRILVNNRRGDAIMGISKLPEKKIREIFREVFASRGADYRNIEEFSIREYHNKVAGNYDFRIITDYSGSMAHSVTLMEMGLRTFVTQGPDHWKYRWLRFDHRLLPYIPDPVSKKQMLADSNYKGLKHLGGGTALLAGLSQGLLWDKIPDRNPVLFLLTDGMENSSSSYQNKLSVDPNELVNFARANNIRIICGGLGTVDSSLLYQLSAFSGGKFYHLFAPEEFMGMLKEFPILEEHYYEISFVNPFPDETMDIGFKYSDEKGATQTVVSPFDSREVAELSSGSNPRYPQYIKTELTGKKVTGFLQVLALHPFDQAEWNGGQRILENLATYLKANPGVMVGIYSHTDLVGSDSYCMNLSMQRAKKLREGLRSLGVPDSQIQIFGFGKKYPIHPKEYFPWMAQENRRSEFILYQ